MTEPVPQEAVHLGFWGRHKLHVAEKHYGEQLAAWQAQVDGLQHYLTLIDGFTGLDEAQGLVLKKEERVFATVNGAALVETRVAGGHWVSGSSGFSVPVGSIGGRSIRYHAGRTRGHYVQGEPSPIPIDTGIFAVTSQRAVFIGSRQTRECAFAKLVGYRHDGGEVTLSVANRQKPTTVHFGAELEVWFVERFELALAHFRGTVAQLRGEMAGTLAEADMHRPLPPT